VQLPTSLRDLLVEGLDGYLENFSRSPDAEAVANYVVEELEVWADDDGFDDVVAALEESGSLDTDFIEALEGEMSSNDEFEYTGEEIVSLMERLCDVVWIPDDDFVSDDLSEEEEAVEEEESVEE